jgi:hypothetical protein
VMVVSNLVNGLVRLVGFHDRPVIRYLG